MWPRISHMLASLTNVIQQYTKAKNEGKIIKLIWNKGMQKASDDMKFLFATDAMTALLTRISLFKYILMLLIVN